jgi:hypothetical protein
MGLRTLLIYEGTFFNLEIDAEEGIFGRAIGITPP